MKNLISTLFLGGALVFGGCNRKKAEYKDFTGVIKNQYLEYVSAFDIGFREIYEIENKETTIYVSPDSKKFFELKDSLVESSKRIFEYEKDGIIKLVEKDIPHVGDSVKIQYWDGLALINYPIKKSNSVVYFMGNDYEILGKNKK